MSGKAISFMLPWDVLVPDNQRHGLLRGRIVLTKKYRSALGHAGVLAAYYCRGKKLSGPVTVTARFYEPDKRRRDIMNYAKLICDALSGTAIDDDSQIHEIQWVRVGICKDKPRVDLRISPLTPTKEDINT